MIDYLLRQRLYHLRWALRFGLAGLACIAASLYVWPARGGLITFALGYLCTVLSVREQRLERSLR